MKTQLNIFNSIFILAIISIAFVSCKPTDDENPVITLSEPHINEQDYAVGDTVFIHGEVTDNEELHELEIKLTRQEGGEVLLDETPTVHAMQSYHIDTYYVPTDTTHFHYNLKIEAWDHDNNKAELAYTLHWAQ